MKQQLRKLWLLALCALMSVASAWATDQTVTTQEGLNSAINSASDNDVITISQADTYTLPNAINSSITIQAANNVSVTVEHTGNEAITTIASGKTATFKNITFELGTTVKTATAHGFGTLSGDNGELVMDNCTINGALNLFGVSSFKDCKFNVNVSDVYNIWAINENATFTNCEFTNTNRAVNVYDQKHGSTSKTVSFSGCTFNGSAKKKAAINIHHNPDKLAAGAKFNVSISDNCKTEGTWAANVAETGEPVAETICYSSLWMISDIKNWKNDDIKVTVGTEVQNFSVAQIGEAYYPTLPAAVEAATEGATIKIIKAGNYDIPAITKNLTIEAAEGDNGVVVEHTTNAAITTIAQGKTATFKNITFDLGTTVGLATAHGFGTLNGTNGAVVMDKCTINGALNLFGVSTFTGCTFTASGIYNIWAVNDNATFTNCTFKNTNRAVNVYDQKHGTTTEAVSVSFSYCTFNSTGSEKKKAAINIHHYPDNSQTAGAKFNVTITDCQTTGDNWAANVAETGEPAAETICYSSLWMISDIKNWADGDITVTKDNVSQNVSMSTFVAQIGEAKYPTLQDAVEAAAEGATIKIIKAGKYDIPAITKNLTIEAAEGDNGVVVEHTTNAAITTIASGKTAAFKNITFELGTEALATAHGFGTLNGDNGAVVMTNCTINGALNLFGVSMFIGCKFNASGIYNIWAINDKATFEGCEFTNTNRAVNVYDQKHGTETKEVSFSGCTFNGSAKKKAAINIHHNPDKLATGAKFAVTISNCTTSGDNWAATVAETGEPGGATICYSPLWMISDIKNWKNDDITVKVNDVAQNFSVAQIGEAKYPTLQAAFDAGGAVTLLDDITLESSATVASDKTVTLNLNGKKITSLTADYAIIVEGTLTVNGETDGSVINAFSDKTKKRVFLVKGGQLTINSGTFEGSYPIFVGNGDGSNQPVNGSKVTITGGTFKAQEMCIATRESVNADVNVTGGIFTAIDNAVMGANGTEGFKENQFKISGGTFNGGITSSGYVACGIYAPNNDTWDITGGTFNITGGAGIVQRAGTVNISGDVVFNVTGESSVTGKVGDSRVVVPCSALVFDEKANYPGLTSESKMTVEGGTFTAASGVAAITAVDGTATSRVLVSGGTYSSDPKEFCIDGYSVASDDGKYYVGEVTIPSAPTVSGTNSDNTQATYTVTAVITDDNNNQHSVTTGQPIVVSTDVTGDAGEDVKLGDIKVNDVLTKAIAAVSNSGNDITKVTKVEIGIEASVTAAANTTEKTKAFDVKPVANITVTNAADTKIQLGNEDLTDNATFKFSLDLSDLSLAEGTLVQIVHTSDDPTTYPTETLYASVASGKVNVTTKHFSTFSVSVPAGGTDLASFELTDDGDDYSATHETYPYPSGQNVTGVITYKRAFAAARIGKYQSWFVPFDYVIKEADAAKFNFYKINMVANSAVEGNAETVDANQIWIHLKQMSKDETLYGNMPYVIQPIDGQYTADEVYEFKTSDGTSLKAMNTDAVLSTQTSVATYNFYGTYQNTESTKNHDFLYVNSQGQICWSVYPWSYSIAPYRWIIKMESKGISYAPMLNFVEDDTTGISEKSVANGAYDTSAQYFNMNGQRVQQPTKGLYIVNGKKVIVK